MSFSDRLDYPYKIRMFKVASGNGVGNLEYVCETDQLSAIEGDLVWRIRKLVYDSDGFNTCIYWADGDRSFTKSVTLRASYIYS